MPDEKGIARDAEQFVPVALRQGAAAGVRLAAALGGWSAQSEKGGKAIVRPACDESRAASDALGSSTPVVRLQVGRVRGAVLGARTP